MSCAPEFSRCSELISITPRARRPILPKGLRKFRHALQDFCTTCSSKSGITDLRFGNMHDDDWQGRNRHDQVRDDRRPMPFRTGIEAYAIAVTTADHPDELGSFLIGDGLVPVASALGSYRDKALDLGIPEERRFVATSANHFDLLSRDGIYSVVQGWLK